MIQIFYVYDKKFKHRNIYFENEMFAYYCTHCILFIPMFKVHVQDLEKTYQKSVSWTAWYEWILKDFRGPHQITIPTKVWDLLWSGNFQGFERVPDRFPNQRLIDVLSQLESRSRANLFHDQQGNIWSTDWILFWKSIYKSHQIVHDSQSE